MHVLRRLKSIHLVSIGIALAIDLPAALWFHDRSDKVIVIFLGLALSTALSLFFEINRHIRLVKHDTIAIITLNDLLWKHKELQNCVDNSARYFDAVVRSGDDFLLRLAHEKLTSFESEIRKLGTARLEIYTPEDTYKAVKLFANCTLSDLTATSLVNPEFWTSTDGEEYLQENLRIKNDGGNVSRIFIVQTLKSITSPDYETIKRQIDAGFDIWILPLDDCPEGIKDYAAEWDFAISDHRRVGRIGFKGKGNYQIGGFSYFGSGTADIQVYETVWADFLRYSKMAKDVFAQLDKEKDAEIHNEPNYGGES